MTRIPDHYPWAQDERPVATFQSGGLDFLRYTWPYFFLTLFGIGLACIGLFVPVKEGRAAALSMVVLGFGAAIGLVAWGIVVWVRVIRHVRLYPDGVLWLDGGRWRGGRWDEIEEFYRTEIMVNGGVQTRQVVVKTTDGRQGVFTHALPRWAKLAEQLQMQTTMTIGPAAQAQFRAGEAVVFGPVKVSVRGIKLNGRVFHWDDVGRIEIGNGFLMVYAEGSKSDCESVSLGEVPNYLVLLKILENTPGPAPMLRK